ncbi:unnamed protein product [Symbiodinium natans]|uniref:Uncharacterized protein n=1 Tax=Symbiodinium natans TaxID=878477 RepID=A0A812LBJ9_9DINO|nr:unnamed protein product [Symbiodinium natans]
MGYKWVPTSSFATETSSRLCFVQFCLSGGVVIGNPAETEPPTYEVEQVGRKHNGDPTYQAVLNIKGQGGRIRSLRAPPRANEDDAKDDGEEMKDCFMKHGMPGLRELQQKQRRSRIS